MRITVLKDLKISPAQYEKLTAEFSDFVYDNTGIVPMFFLEERDFKNVPTTPDNDGDDKPTTEYMKALMKTVHDKYGDWGTDSVVMLVHEDNWFFKGIWGSNFSGAYYTYHVHLCRFDKKNIANSLGTLYHEWMHSLDVLIKTHTGVDINQYFKSTKCWVSWDASAVHGNKFHGCKETPYSYIKWKENTDALQMITPDLKKAYAKRKEMYYKPYVTALWQAVDYLRGLLNKKNGTSNL